MTRRDFISNTCMATAGSVLAGHLLATNASRYKMGLQLFTIRDAMAKDSAGTLQQIATMGYEDTETYGYDPASSSYYGMKAKDFAQLLSDNGLKSTSGHYDLFKYLNTPQEELLAYTDQCIAGAYALGQKYITWPWVDPNDRNMDKFKLLASRLKFIGERVKNAGSAFAYHNHDFDFIDHNGKNGYEFIINETEAGLVKLQIDLYWVCRASKLTPGELFRKQPGRFVMWHIKDMDKVTQDYTELGNGSIDYSKIVADRDISGLEYYYLEQGGNFKKNSMESVKESADFFKKNLRRYL